MIKVKYKCTHCAIELDKDNMRKCGYCEYMFCTDCCCSQDGCCECHEDGVVGMEKKIKEEIKKCKLDDTKQKFNRLFAGIFGTKDAPESCVDCEYHNGYSGCYWLNDVVDTNNPSCKKYGKEGE